MKLFITKNNNTLCDLGYFSQNNTLTNIRIKADTEDMTFIQGTFMYLCCTPNYIKDL